MTVQVNATYVDLPVGTGTYTRNLLAALPEARRLRLPQRLTRASAAAYWTRRAAEVAMGTVPGTTVHPYWSATAGRRQVLAPLDFVQYREANRFDRRLLRRAAQRSGCLLALSAHTAREFEDTFAQRVVIAPPFPDVAWYAPPVTAPAVSGPLRVAYWGGDHPRKQIDVLLGALPGTGLEIEIHHTGRLTAPQGVATVSHGTATADDLVRMVDSCHLSVYPSREEGFGLPVFESLLRDRPVLISPLEVYTEFTKGPAVITVHDWGDTQEVRSAIEAGGTVRERPVESLLRPTRDTAVAQLRLSLTQALEVIQA